MVKASPIDLLFNSSSCFSKLASVMAIGTTSRCSGTTVLRRLQRECPSKLRPENVTFVAQKPTTMEQNVRTYTNRTLEGTWFSHVFLMVTEPFHRFPHFLSRRTQRPTWIAAKAGERHGIPVYPTTITTTLLYTQKCCFGHDWIYHGRKSTTVLQGQSPLEITRFSSCFDKLTTK